MPYLFLIFSLTLLNVCYGIVVDSRTLQYSPIRTDQRPAMRSFSYTKHPYTHSLWLLFLQLRAAHFAITIGNHHIVARLPLNTDIRYDRMRSVSGQFAIECLSSHTALT